MRNTQSSTIRDRRYCAYVNDTAGEHDHSECENMIADRQAEIRAARPRPVRRDFKKWSVRP